MRNADRERLKENLRTMIATGCAGLDLDTPFHWVVEGIQAPTPFFTNLTRLIPHDANLYVEGCTIAPEVATFYLANDPHNAVAVVRDTVFPEPDIYHVGFTPHVAARLQEFAAVRPYQEICDHLKAYRGNALLFTFHDAFTGYLLISEHLSEPVVLEFCRRLDVTCRREPTKKRDPEQLRAFLKLMEHPNPEQIKIRFKGEPWWKRCWREAKEEFLKGWREG